MADVPPLTETSGHLDSLTPTPLVRRSNQTSERPPLPADIEEQFNHLQQAVQALSAHFLGETTDPATETLKERTARRVKKFHRAGGEDRSLSSSLPTGEEMPSEIAAENAPDTGDETSEGLALNKHIAWPRQHALGNHGENGPSTRQRGARRSGLGMWLGAQALCLLLLVAGYLIGRTNGPANNRGDVRKRSGHTAVDLFGQPELTEQAFQTANEGLHAEHAGEADAARKIYETALAKHVNLAGMNYRLALMAIQRNDRLEAEQRLEHSVLDGEYVPECGYILARLAADKGDFEDAANEFQRAARAEPFEGKHFFYWGEMLRRQGKPQAAVAAFEQALDRPYNAETGDLYLFKQRLAKVEYGHDDAFNTELSERLKQPPVAGEWLLLAAAQELDHQAFPAAADHLRQAVDRLPSSIYAGLTHDYFFQTYAKRSEVASLLNHTSALVVSSAGPTILDPGAWSSERADPAMWPSASNATKP